MKKLLAVILFIGTGVTGAMAQSYIIVSLADGSPLNVSVDGRYFNKRGTSVTVGDLPPGKHLLQIYSMRTDRRGRGREDVIYEGKVKTFNGIVTLLTYDQGSGEAMTDQQDANGYNFPAPQRAAPEDAQQYNSTNQPPNNGYLGNNRFQQNNNGQYNNDNAQNGQDNTDNAPAASPVQTGTLTEDKIKDLKNKVQNVKTDVEITNQLKAALETETMTTFQVSELMDLLSFESSKVDLAEWAYSKVTDKDIFGDQKNKLTYQNYRDDLDKFIKSKQ